MKALLADAVSRRALAKLGGLKDLDAAQVERIAALQYWHDVGKAATGFAVKSVNDANKPAETGHVEEAFALFDGDLAKIFEHCFGLTQVSAWFAGSQHAARDFLMSALSHHGRPVKLPSGSADMAQLTKAWTPWKDIDPPTSSPACPHARCDARPHGDRDRRSSRFGCASAHLRGGAGGSPHGTWRPLRADERHLRLELAPVPPPLPSFPPPNPDPQPRVSRSDLPGF
jgi:hypothetical protein